MFSRTFFVAMLLVASLAQALTYGLGGWLAVGGKVTGVELGMLLSFMASRVLGQYETFAPAGREMPAGEDGGGRLLLVAPNIVHVERELDVQPHDFRLWVTLHEETHRTQFTGVPWLKDHLQGEIQSFLSETEIDPMTVLERLREAAQSLTGNRPEGEEDEEGEDDGEKEEGNGGGKQDKKDGGEQKKE